MALLDNFLYFGDTVDVAQTANTYLFPNQIDLQTVRDVGRGEPLYLVLVSVPVGGEDEGILTGGSAGTIQFALVSDDSATIHASTRSVHLLTKAYVTDGNDANEIGANQVFFVGAIPTDGVEPYERFLGLQYIVASQTTTEGHVSAYLTTDPGIGVPKAYPDAQNEDV